MSTVSAKDKNQRGVVMLLALVVMFSVAAIGVAMVTSANINSTMARNYKSKIQAFYAADGQMSLLAQQVIDSNENKYMKDSLALHSNIGTGTDPATAGSYTIASGVHTITGSGSDFWDGSGSHAHFAYDTIYGDADIRVKLDSISNPNNVSDFTSPKAGILICNSLNQFAAYAFLIASPKSSSSASRGVYYEARQGDSSSSPAFGNPGNTTLIPPNCYLRLVRSGNSFTVYYSSDGLGWNNFSTFTIPMHSTVLAGLAVCAHDNSKTCMAMFSHLRGLSFPGAGTAKRGSYLVDWTMKLASTNSFSLTSKAYNNTTTWGAVFQTPLTQYIQRQGGGLVNPYGDTANLPVTFYDFHSNRTNPEFEQPSTLDSVPEKNMVQDTLDSDRKPMVKLPQNGGVPRRNYYISKWFRPWVPGDFTIPVYKNTVLQLNAKNHQYATPQQLTRWKIPTPNLRWGACDCYGDTVGNSWGYEFVSGVSLGGAGADDSAHVIDTAYTDTAFKNIVIQDTLPFIHDTLSSLPQNTSQKVPQGTYHFCSCDTGDSHMHLSTNTSPFSNKYNNGSFFYIDNRGFGNEWNQWNVPGLHNYSFTMEMKRSFVMVDSLFFQFLGDDDVWVFINNRLELDLGGVHGFSKGFILLDTIGKNDASKKLQKLQTYNFDLFYTDRHSTGCNIEIMTNLLVYYPTTTRQRHWSRDYGNLN